MSDEQALQAAIARLSNIPEHEVRKIHGYWKSLRRRAENPAELIGWKY